MTIEIIETKLIEDVTGQDPAYWACWIEIDDGLDSYLLATTLPGSVLEADLQTALDAKEAELFVAAQGKGIVPDDLYTRVATNRVLKAFALAVLDEINILRGVAALAPRTTAQLRQAVKNKLKVL